MHIPDGFLDLKTAVATAAASTALLGYSIKQTKKQLEERQIPLMGVMAAFIFAAQMINFPIIGGTSGHLVGGVLAAVAFGPWTASLIITSILILQSLLFYDGGLTVLGANILNMAIIAPFLGYGVYRGVSLIIPNSFGRILAVFLAGWVSVLASAIAAAVELAVSGLADLQLVLSAMVFWHFFIGLGEGAITAAIVAYLTKVRPELVSKGGKVNA